MLSEAFPGLKNSKVATPSLEDEGTWDIGCFTNDASLKRQPINAYEIG